MAALRKLRKQHAGGGKKKKKKKKKASERAAAYITKVLEPTSNAPTSVPVPHMKASRCEAPACHASYDHGAHASPVARGGLTAPPRALHGLVMMEASCSAISDHRWRIHRLCFSPNRRQVRATFASALLGFPVRVHPYFWLVTGLRGHWFWRRGTRPAEFVGWVAVVFVSILVHELGHAVMQRRLRRSSMDHALRIGRPSFLRRLRSSSYSQIIISLAGPIAGHFWRPC